jgi:hypothetical protein
MLDPYFWFPRLWDKFYEMTEFAGVQLTSIKIDPAPHSVNVIFPDSIREWGRSDHPCIALCEAIEAWEDGSATRLTEKEGK